MAKILSVRDLTKLCMEEVRNGNGDKKILLSQDDEGNGFHALFYHFTPLDESFLRCIHSSLDVTEENMDDYIILG